MKQGFTLIEVIVSLGVLAVVLPATTLFLLQILHEQGEAQAELQMEQASSLLLSELRVELAESHTIDVTSSTFGDDNGVLVFTERSDETVTIDRPTVDGVRRLRLQRGVDPAVYLSPRELDVTSWRVDATRTDEDDALTGLRFHVDFVLVNPSVGPYRAIEFLADTTIALNPQTTEL